MSTQVAELRTRKPTGKPSWPMLLLAGAEKSGKSYNAALASASPLVGRTLWITIGEDEPDEYGQLGDFDIVQHDGTYRGILDAIRLAALEPPPADGVPLLVVDSMTRLWDLITSHAQDVANARLKKRGKGSPDQDAQITMDLWNAAKDQWQNVMDAIRTFPGPVILTARLDVVAVMNDAGQPTPQKTTKVQAHKSLPYDVGAVIEMPARGETWITGVRSVRLQLGAKTQAPKDFTVDWFWRQLGLAELETGTREHRPSAHAPAFVEDVPESKPEPRHTVESRARLRDPGATGPDKQRTPAGGSRPSPSRTVENSGAGRATHEVYPQTQNLAKASNAQGPTNVQATQRTPPEPQEPSEETRAAVANYVELIAAEDNIERLRDLHGDASAHGLLAQPTADGRRLNDVFYARREAILQAQEMPPALDGVEDDA